MGRDVSRDKDGDQAAWRDLVARLELPSPVDPASVPWPDRESLRAPGQPGQPGQGQGDDPDQQSQSAQPAADGQAGEDGTNRGKQPPATRGHVIRPASAPTPPARPAPPKQAAGGQASPGQGAAAGAEQAAAQGGQSGESADDAETPTSPDLGILDLLDLLEDQDRNGRYIPPKLPPAPKLDPVVKGAWTALFGGPGYLLVASMFGWPIPSWAELAAIAAFVTGFVVLVSRLGDGPSRKDGPDQGAVV